VADEGPIRYRLTIPGPEREKLRAWGEWARGAGVMEDYLTTLRTIHFRLTCEPSDWGEPRFTLPNLKVQVRFATCGMLNVWFGVDPEERVVCLKTVQFSRNYPHGSPPEE
jgi:hypothetical protein